MLISSRLGKFGYSLADQALSVGGMFVVNIALARVRSKEEYGTFALSYSVFTFLSGLHNASILEAYTIYGSGRYHHRFTDYRKVLWRTNGWMLAALSALLLAIWQCLRWMNSTLASPALLGVALSSGALLTASFMRRTFYMKRRPELAARFSTFFFAGCMILLALAVRHHLLNGLTAFLIVGLAWTLAGLLAGRWAREESGPANGEDFMHAEPGYWSEHWKYSRWVLVTALVFQFTAQAYFWMVAGFVSVREVAEMRALYNLVLPMDQVFAAIMLLALPQMALQYAAGEHAALRRLWQQCSLLFAGISAAFALAVELGGSELLHIVYGGKFDSVSSLLRWYALLPVVMAFGNASNAALKAIERPHAVFYAYLTSCAATFILGVPLVIRFGLRGAIYGTLLSSASYTAALSSSFYRFHRSIRPGDGTAKEAGACPRQLPA